MKMSAKSPKLPPQQFVSFLFASYDPLFLHLHELTLSLAKALELFMIALVTKGAAEARASHSKRVTAQHLKTALMNDGQFDFLTDICENIPDEASKKGRAKSEPRTESDEEVVPKKKPRAARKKKADSDDESD